ncbi:MAG: glutamate--tRNA ligase [Nocardioidaceae bacterium]|nr:glutamate--tRNA ligase [Nocardioidaceae bacterium]
MSPGAPDGGVRVRFCPSPTGNPHVGLARTALFNWAFARHHGGTFVFRIEDTDASRDTEESYVLLLDVMRWLGLEWDEGPEVGGPHGPYRQSQRSEVYDDVARRLRDARRAYPCYCSQEELDERREQARAEGRSPGYDGHCRSLDDDQVAAYEREGRKPLLRLRMPDHDIGFTDLVRGEVVFGAEHVSDYVLVRANGRPLYTLVNPVDDALMRVTHVLRGEDLLSSTPRQIALFGALGEIGVGDGRAPAYGHLPAVLGEGNRKLSKRDPESNMLGYRDRGYLPEGLLNYLALLGWSIAEDRDVFTVDEMVAAFDIARVNPNPARFDPKKCEAINATHVRRLEPGEFADRLLPFVSAGDPALLAAAAPLVQERATTLAEAGGMLDFLFVDDAEFVVNPADADQLGGDGAQVVKAARSALAELDGWHAADIEAALRTALVDGLGLKPRHAFGPVRVAVTGRRVSPPLFESLELLGRGRSLRRLDQALA